MEIRPKTTHIKTYVTPCILQLLITCLITKEHNVNVVEHISDALLYVYCIGKNIN